MGPPSKPGGTAPDTVVPLEPVRRVAPGQSVVLYRGDAVVGGGVVVRADSGRVKEHP